MLTPSSERLRDQRIQRVQQFYSAFAALDGAAMQACYAHNARFEDPVFSLNGRDEIGAMWRMLCTNASNHRGDWQLTFSDVRAPSQRSYDKHEPILAQWQARYRFGNGRIVHNHISARFHFDEDDQFAHHQDQFGLWQWSRQALGVPGLLLGWSPMFKLRLRQQAAQTLKRYRAKQ